MLRKILTLATVFQLSAVLFTFTPYRTASASDLEELGRVYAEMATAAQWALDVAAGKDSAQWAARREAIRRFMSMSKVYLNGGDSHTNADGDAHANAGGTTTPRNEH